jgi:hypothetical protein
MCERGACMYIYVCVCVLCVHVYVCVSECMSVCYVAAIFDRPTTPTAQANNN